MIRLVASHNEIKELKLSLHKLKTLACDNNKLHKLLVNSKTLTTIYCFENNITDLTLATPELKYFHCYNIKLKRYSKEAKLFKKLKVKYTEIQDSQLVDILF